MNELRWILIGFGIVLLAAIYLWGRRGNRAVACRGRRAAALRGPSPRCTAPSRRCARPVERSNRWRRRTARRRRRPVEPPCRRHATSASRRHLARPARADVRRCADRRDAGASGSGSATLGCSADVVVERSSAVATCRAAQDPVAAHRDARRSGSRARSCWRSLLAESLQHGKYDIFHRAAHRRQHRLQRREHGRARHVRSGEDGRDALSRHHDVHAASRARCRACMRSTS